MGLEKYCSKKLTGTYNSTHQNGDKSYGGYALYNRVPAHFAIKIPDGVSSAAAVPMLCGGVTLYSPLKPNGCGPGKRVGIIGVGGLGRFGVMFAKSMGADKVVAISRKTAKSEDAIKMGADLYIATEDEPDWATTHARSLDLSVCTVSSTEVRRDVYREGFTDIWLLDAHDRLLGPFAHRWQSGPGRPTRGRHSLHSRS